MKSEIVIEFLHKEKKHKDTEHLETIFLLIILSFNHLYS